MKLFFRIPLAFFFIVVLISGCSKENPVQSASNDISGSWKLVKVIGGIAGTSTEPGPNAVEIISITNSGKFTKYLNNTQIFSSDIIIQIEKSIYSQEPIEFIHFVSDPKYYSKLAVLHISGKELILADNYFDGYSYHYELISRKVR